MEDQPTADPHAPDPTQTKPEGAGIFARIHAFKEKNDQLLMVLFFVGGFLFDAVMLSRIDEPPMLIQQGAYLAVCGFLLAITQHFEIKKKEPPKFLKKPWHYVEHVLHFMLGTLLNAYSIFYFQSASGVTAIGFVLFICALLALNELPRFQKMGPVVVYALYSICLTSYFGYLYPVLFGHIRPWMFYLAVGTAVIPLVVHLLLLLRWTHSYNHVARHMAVPAFGVQLLFVLVYSLRIAPPVPLAIKQIGIYHDVKHEADGWRLTHQPKTWKFWQKGDQEFLERAGDKVWCFARIFAPRHFRDSISAVWFHDDPEKGWTRVYSKPLSISASSEVGFATDAYLSHPAEGKWRVEIQSQDGRTMGLLHFKVTRDESTEPRELEETFSSSEPADKKH